MTTVGRSTTQKEWMSQANKSVGAKYPAQTTPLCEPKYLNNDS